MSNPDFVRHFSPFEQALLKFAYVLTKDQEAANDLYQETAYKAFKNRSFFESGTNMKAWVFTIMRNTFINQFRYQKRRQLLQDHSTDSFLLNSGGNTIQNMGESELNMQELMKLVNQLEPRIQEPFLLYYQGYRYREIAEQLSAPVGTIKSRIFEARQQLRHLIEQVYKTPKVSVAA